MRLIDFTQYQAVKRLQTLAEKPYDLSAEGTLSSQRIASYSLSSCGFDLLYATQRVDDQVLDSLQDLADEAGLVDAFLAMKSGSVLNKIDGYESENRQVLHTASRDIFSDLPSEPAATDMARDELERLRLFLTQVDQKEVSNEKGETFTTMLQVGIGGSDLGPRALCLALEPYRIQGRQAAFIANVDPDDVAGVIGELDLSRTLVNVVSKSGTTLETLTNERLVREALQAKGLDPTRHIIAVTGQGSPMDDPAQYLASFYMYDFIGGRYSATSMVGGVTLGFVLGYEGFVDLLRGADMVDRAAEEKEIRKNIPLLLAMLGIWNHNFLGHASLAVLPYSQALSRFPAHLQQCDMESNGKSVTRQGRRVQWKTGPIVWGEPGTNGQHAFYQLLHQGTEIVPAEFIGFRKSQYGVDLEVEKTTSQQKLVANMLAQSLALAKGMLDDNPAKVFQGNRPNLVLMADQLTPFSMGSLLAIYEAKIAFQGFCWNINSFDQEGVQLGKILASKLLTILAGKGEAQMVEQDKKSEEWSLLKAAGMLGK